MKLLPFLFLLVLILSVWLMPSITFALGIFFVLVSLSLAVFFIFRKHQTAYLQRRITRSDVMRNTFLDVLGVLLTMALAVLLARFVAGLVTGPVNDGLIRQIAGILVGLSTGIVVGIIASRLWGRLVKTSLQS